MGRSCFSAPSALVSLHLWRSCRWGSWGTLTSCCPGPSSATSTRGSQPGKNQKGHLAPTPLRYQVSPSWTSGHLYFSPKMRRSLPPKQPFPLQNGFDFSMFFTMPTPPDSSESCLLRVPPRYSAAKFPT